jgi:hypothetical protein
VGNDIGATEAAVPPIDVDEHELNAAVIWLYRVAPLENFARFSTNRTVPADPVSVKPTSAAAVAPVLGVVLEHPGNPEAAELVTTWARFRTRQAGPTSAAVRSWDRRTREADEEGMLSAVLDAAPEDVVDELVVVVELEDDDPPHAALSVATAARRTTAQSDLDFRAGCNLTPRNPILDPP